MISSLIPDSEETHAKRVYRLIAAGFLFPIFLYSSYVLVAVPTVGMWTLVIFGLLASTLGAATLVLLIRGWEHFVRSRIEVLTNSQVVEPTPVEAPPVVQAEHGPELGKLKEDLALWREKSEQQALEIRSLEEVGQSAQAQNEELSQKVASTAKEFGHKEGLLQDYQQTIVEQRAIIDKKQQYVAKLEAKVQDLQYEVKTLLQLGELGVQSVEGSRAEGHPALDAFPQGQALNSDIEEAVQALPASSDRRVCTHYDAAVQLQKSVEVAKSLTGASHLSSGEGSRFRDLSMDSYAIDLRRLFDSLRSETSATILLYSQKDGKLLFVNNQIKGLVGWTPETFVKDFPQLIQSSFAEWRHAVSRLADQPEVQVQLVTRSRSGTEVPLHCYLGIIPDGAFSGHVIGVVYPAEEPSATSSL